MFVKRDFYWESAHRLPNHKGLCRHLHGHSYRAECVFNAPVQEDGISIDFGDLKIIQQQIDSLLDHGTLVWEKDTPLLSWLVQNGQRHMRFSNPPTAEVIAQYLVDLCRKHSLPIHAVRVWETAKCSVEEICG